MKLVIIIPVYNEEISLADVLRGMPATVAGFDTVVTLVIDDGSTDGTAAVARRYGATVIAHERNRGLGMAFRTGINAALQQDADVAVTIDGDRQFDPAEIPKLVKPIREGKADMVSGSRFSEPAAAKNVPPLRRFGNKIFTGLLNYILNSNFSDTQCGFRAYGREAMLRLNLFSAFTYTQEVFIDLVAKGLRVSEVPISVRYFADRKPKISKSLWQYGFRALGIVLTAFRDRNPLKFFGIPGTGILLGGVCADLFAFVYWLRTHVTTPIRMLFFVGTAAIGIGLVLIVFAFLADMLQRIRQNQDEMLYSIKRQRRGNTSDDTHTEHHHHR